MRNIGIRKDKPMIRPLFLLLLTAACSSQNLPTERKPSAATVARIERKLAKDPCTGALAGLTRSYAYPWRGGAVDDRTIFVTLQSPRTMPAIVIAPPDHHGARPGAAHGWGIYDVRNDRLTLSACSSAV
jgi:hypothetical protein